MVEGETLPNATAVTNWFHVAAGLYQPGDQIAPGNWGRVVLGAGAAHGRFYRELFFERVRRDEYPESPSRLMATFACLSLDDAVSFRDNTLQAPHSHIYRVSAVDAACASTVVDMRWLDIFKGCRTLDGIDSVARRYWAGEVLTDNWREVIVAGPLRVEQRLSLIAEDQPPLST